jgi:hypothetical protein
MSRRGKQKQDFGRSDGNRNREDFIKRDKNKKNKSNSKREKKSNLEGGLNKDDKKVSQGKQVNAKTLSISKKGRNSELKVDVKSKKTKKDKI